MTLESNQELIQGAEVLAAGRTLGLSDDETISIKRRKVRENIDKRRAERAEREGNRAAAEAFLAESDKEFKAKGQPTDFEKRLALGGAFTENIDDEAFAFGEDPIIQQDLKGRRLEMEARRPQDDDQVLSREEKVRNDVLGPDFLQEDEIAQQMEGRRRDPSGINGVRDALARLEMAKEQFGFEAFGEEGKQMEAIYNRLKGGKNELDAERKEAGIAREADERRRRGDLSDDEIASEVDRLVRNARNDRMVRLQGPAELQVRPGRAGIPARKNIVEPVALVKEPELRLNPERARNPQAVRNEAAMAQKAVEDMIRQRSDGRRGGPELRAMQNDARAAAEASDIAQNFTGRGSGAMADDAIGRIREIRSLGVAGGAGHGTLAEGNFQVIDGVNPSTFPDAVPLIGKDGMPIAFFEKKDDGFLQLGVFNEDNTANILNAPNPSPVMEFVGRNQPDFGKNGVFGVPQVPINDVMMMLGDRVRGLKDFGFENVGNPRSLADVEKMLGAVVGRGQKLGKRFNRFDPEKNVNRIVANPGVDDVLDFLNFGPREKENLAFALLQVEQLRAQPQNKADKDAFFGRTERPQRNALVRKRLDGDLVEVPRDDVVMNVAELREDGGLPLRKVRNEKVGGKGVRAQLRAINDEAVMRALKEQGKLTTKTPDGRTVLLPEAARIIAGAQQGRNDAQMPLIGALANEELDRARFIKGKNRGKSEAQLVEEYGAKGIVGAEVERRYNEDQALQQAKRDQANPPARQFMDQQFDSEVNQRIRFVKSLQENAERKKLADLIERGAQFAAKPNELYSGRIVPGADKGRKLQLPNESALFQGEIPQDKGVQEARIKREALARRQPGAEEMLARSGEFDIPETPVQPTAPAAVPASIALDTSAGTGNQATPIADAGGGMQKPPRNTGVAAPAPGGSGPMPSDMRNELFSLPGPYQKKYMSDPEGPGKQSSAYTDRARRGLEEFRTSPKYQRGRRIAYGAGGGAAALATVLGLGNMGKEEEEQQY